MKMLKKLAFMLVALTGFGVANHAALAAATPELKVSQTVEVAAPPAQVWAIIKNFSDMSWHPAVKSDTATDGNNVGSTRTLDLGGPKLIEQLTKYSDAKLTYSYKITADPANVKTLPVTDYKSTIIVKKSATGSTVVWRGTFHRADPSPTPAAGQDDAAATAAVTGVYRGGLDNLPKLVAQH